jgi:glycosyltransferase involved in cell wall biosynthesis
MRSSLNFLDNITVLILTYNEEQNIARTLAALSRFHSIVVVDSGSTDKTVEIVKNFKNIVLFARPFDEHASQWNFGLHECGIKTPWVLALDADYIVSNALVDEIANLTPGSYTAFRAAFEYRVFGHPLTGTLYPPVTVLFRAKDAKYIQVGHTQRVQTSGPVGAFSARIAHDDRKPLERWFASQQKYAKLEVDFIQKQPLQNLRFSDRIRRVGWAAPILVFVYALFIKRCLFHGWLGWYYVLQRTIAEMMIATEIVDRRLREKELKGELKKNNPSTKGGRQ